MTDLTEKSNSRLRSVWHLVMGVVIAALAVWWVGKHLKGNDQTFPAKAIEVIVPYPAGGGSDTFVRRVIQQGIDEGGLLDVPLAVINIPGGGGTIGSREVKDSRPDGYRVLCHHTSMISSKLAGTVAFGPDDFDKFAQTGQNTMIVMVREDCPYPDLRSLLDEAAKSPKTLTFGANVGSAAYFITLQLEKSVPGAKFSIVSADGGADRYNRLIGGHLNAGIFSLSEYLDFRDSDDTPADRNVKALAVFEKERHPAIPETMTTIEQEIPVLFSNNYYWWSAKGTPPEIQNFLADILEKAMATEIAQSEMKRLHIDPTFLRGEAVEESIQATVEGFQSVVIQEEKNVPNFALYVQFIVLALLIAVLVEAYRQRYDPIPATTSIPGDEIPFTKRPGRAAACFIALVTYVISLVVTPIPFAIASIIMVFVVGGVMSGWERKYLPVLAQLALLTGFGAEFVFTKVFTIPLP
ncbi:tripartite tricarboxylate transporter substrate-binding protein [Verrucomicrobiales bacterium]|nr:tripartite tricarboxylate transporter substrate-binding protein [Verrucomicrobiales bacterium]